MPTTNDPASVARETIAARLQATYDAGDLLLLASYLSGHQSALIHRTLRVLSWFADAVVFDPDSSGARIARELTKRTSPSRLLADLYTTYHPRRPHTWEGWLALFCEWQAGEQGQGMLADAEEAVRLRHAGAPTDTVPTLPAVRRLYVAQHQERDDGPADPSTR